MADTRATVLLKAHGVAYTEHEYEYVDHGGTEVSSRALGVPEHMVVKTLQDLERSILELPKIYINGGRRGFLVGLAPGEIVRLLRPVLVDVALAD